MNPVKTIAALTIPLGLASLLMCASPVAQAAEDDNNAYVQHNLVSDGVIPADHTDSNFRTPDVG